MERRWLGVRSLGFAERAVGSCTARYVWGTRYLYAKSESEAVRQEKAGVRCGEGNNVMYSVEERSVK